MDTIDEFLLTVSEEIRCDVQQWIIETNRQHLMLRMLRAGKLVVKGIKNGQPVFQKACKKMD